MFPNGVGKYVDLMEDLIPEMKDGTIRTAIDTGCGVSLASFCVFISVFLSRSVENSGMLKFCYTTVYSAIASL